MHDLPLPPDTSDVDHLFGHFDHRITFQANPIDVTYARTDTMIIMTLTMSCGCVGHSARPLSWFDKQPLREMMEIGAIMVADGYHAVLASVKHHPLDTLKADVMLAFSGPKLAEAWVVALTDILVGLTASRSARLTGSEP
jgi:hypothetical protein